MLLRMSDDETVLVVALHHMYSDGWSRAVFFRELGVAYQAAISGEVPRLTPLTVDYADYAAWEHEWTAGDEHRQQLDAWRERLRGVPARLELPGATGVVSVGSAACRVETTLAPQSLAALQGRARGGGHTLFALLLSALDVVVSRHACEEDVLVVTPTANRRFPESEPLIGFFANAAWHSSLQK